MKNRHLLIILIFGFVGQTAQAMSHVPSNQDLPLNKHIQSFVFISFLKPRINQIINDQLKKYHPDIKSDDIKWFVSNQWVANRDKAIGIPFSFVSGQKKDISSIHHELTHIKKQHLLKEDSYINRSFFSRLLYAVGFRQSFNDLCKKHEWEADEKIPNNPEMLEEQMNEYKQLITSPTLKEAQAIWNDQKAKSHFIEKDPRHPSFEERAARFEERLNRLESFNKAKEHFRNPKIQKFFGSDLPPVIESPFPRNIANKLGVCEDYYPNDTFDMPNKSRIANIKQELERLYCDS